MTEYLVLKRIPTGDTKVDLVEALTDLGYVRPDMSEDELQIYIAQARIDQLEAERDQARQARDINASYKDDYNNRWQSARRQRDVAIQKGNRFGEELNELRYKARAHKEQISKLDKERDELLDMLDDMKLRTDKAEAATHQARVERDEAKAEAMTALEAIEKITAERERRPKIDPTTLPEGYFVILESHPDKPDTRVPCARCGHTEFTKIAHHGLYCNKCAALNPLSGERKPSCLSCGGTDYVWYFDNGEVAYCSDCRDGPPPPKTSLKYALCPGCNRLLTTLGDGLTGTCCLCGAELSPPVCPHCGHDTFEPVRPFTVGTFNADGTLALPGLYSFCCAKCGKEVGNLPLKRTDE